MRKYADSQNPYPDKVRKAIDEIRTILKDIVLYGPLYI